MKRDQLPTATVAFWRGLHDGSLGLPAVPALATDVYAAYLIFCARNDTPHDSMRLFSMSAAVYGVPRWAMRVINIADEVPGLRSVYVMGTPLEDPIAEARRADHGVLTFHAKTAEYAEQWRRFGRVKEVKDLITDHRRPPSLFWWTVAISVSVTVAAVAWAIRAHTGA